MHRHPRVTALCVLGVVWMCGVAYAGPSLRQKLSPRHRLNEFELAPILLHSTTRVNLSEVEDRVMPMLSALPQNRSGYVCPQAARYALVRYFLVYRGWNIKGLSQENGVWNAFPTDSVLRSRYATMLLRLIVKILRKPLVGINDLVSIVLAVETLIYDNVRDILMLAYDTLDVPVEEPLRDPDQQKLVLDTFATLLLQPRTQRLIAEKPVEQYWKDVRNNSESQPYWHEIYMWVADTSQTAKHALVKPFSKGMDFASMSAIAEAISSNIAGFQQSACMSMKHRLMDADGTEDGTLSLASFYQPSLGDHWWSFKESPKYLEFIDALDMSTPHHEKVLIPNYVISSGNCADTSTFHQVCCISECEFLMTRLEAAVRKPYVSPVAVLEAVAALDSDTVRAPRKLSESLQNRLYEISRVNGAAVPLHGRMFSEWMHRAFPNECPMPASKHLRTGGLQGQDRLVFKREMGDIIKAELQSNGTDNTTMARFFEREEDAGDAFQMPWSEAEDLLLYQDWNDFFATEEQRAAAAADDASDPTSIVQAWLRLIVAAVAFTTFPLAGLAQVPQYFGSNAKGEAWLP